MLSRVLGLVRDVLFAALLGATKFADAFNAAFMIPNLVRDLFAEGALSAAFVPTFTDYLKNHGKEDAFRLANLVVGALLVIVGGIAVLGVLGAPWVVAVAVPGYSPEKQELTVRATRLLFPFLPIVSLAAIAMGQLNSQERYTAPSLAGAAFNVAAIVAGTVLLVWPAAGGGLPGEILLLGWSGGILLGGVAQLAIQLGPLRRTGFRFRPAIGFRHPGVRRIMRLMGPAVVGVAATNVNIMVNYSFASEVEGAVSWLRYAFRLMWLPIGVFGIAVATIATTRLAQRAAERDMAGMRATLGEGLRLVGFLTVPSMFGLFVLSEPIVRLVLRRGQYLGSDVGPTAAALQMYALGLVAYSAVKVAAPAFYALDRARVPVIASISAVAVNVALNFALFPALSHRGLALGTAAAALVNVTILVATFHRAVGGLDLRGLAGHLALVVLAAVPAAAAAYAVEGWLDGLLGHASTIARVGAVGPAIVCAVAVYAVGCRLLRLRELDEVAALVRRKVGSGR